MNAHKLLNEVMKVLDPYMTTGASEEAYHHVRRVIYDALDKLAPPKLDLNEVEKVVQYVSKNEGWVAHMSNDAYSSNLRSRIGYTLSDLPAGEKYFCQCDDPQFRHGDNETCARCNKEFDKTQS